MSVEWLAGLLEGEGCFTTAKNNFGYMRVALAMTDKDVVERAALAFPGSSAVHTMNRRGTWKTVYSVSWCGPDAYACTRAVLPYMGQRRTERILGLMANYQERRMQVCLYCDVEFACRDGSTRKLRSCSPVCSRARRTKLQREVYSHATH